MRPQTPNKPKENKKKKKKKKKKGKRKKKKKNFKAGISNFYRKIGRNKKTSTKSGLIVFQTLLNAKRNDALFY